jgi:hypothetical protein
VHPGEWLILLIAAVALVVRCFRDRARPLWCDEAYTAFAVSDPSFTHMLEGLRDEINDHEYPCTNALVGSSTVMLI